MTKLQVQKTAKKSIHIHNDISNTAQYLKTRIEEKEATGDRYGIALDITACLVMLAFTFESRLNFIGQKKLPGFRERRWFDKKVELVLRGLKLEPDFSKRPYSSIKELKDFRDTIAHGKPETVVIDELVDFHPEADYDDFDLRGAWEGCLNIDFMRRCSEDIDDIWKEWLAIAEIDVHQTITHGEYGITLIEEPMVFGG
ncbi:hypothetical protein [Pseudomonas fluorescens]|uniref:RiboL-PSP-HEPN domain-containing protein n=1 Tax=Pseudomonas fluorescens TaxID=294 RepID=A0A7Z6MWQ6_PSEFL|nr:hypothetical protein [Pseudomonas fluorescens]RDS90432.1 hypothetical protein DL347_13530 [Pseudomonas fluorescens]